MSTRIVKKLGTYDQLIKEHDDPEAWAREVVAEMNRQAQEGKQKVLVAYSPSELIKKDDVIPLVKSRSFDVLIVLGAGDLDEQVPQIANILKRKQPNDPTTK